MLYACSSFHLAAITQGSNQKQPVGLALALILSGCLQLEEMVKAGAREPSPQTDRTKATHTSFGYWYTGGLKEDIFSGRHRSQ